MSDCTCNEMRDSYDSEPCPVHDPEDTCTCEMGEMGMVEHMVSGCPIHDPGLVPVVEFEAIHGWFGLTYANYLCLPRTLLQSMPDEWQTRFVDCLRELDAAYDHLDLGKVNYTVSVRDDVGRWARDPVPHYNRGRTRVEPRLP